MKKPVTPKEAKVRFEEFLQYCRDNNQNYGPLDELEMIENECEKCANCAQRIAIDENVGECCCEECADEWNESLTHQEMMLDRYHQRLEDDFQQTKE